MSVEVSSCPPNALRVLLEVDWVISYLKKEE